MRFSRTGKSQPCGSSCSTRRFRSILLKSTGQHTASLPTVYSGYGCNAVARSSGGKEGKKQIKDMTDKMRERK
jgi:hypothetical protein